MNPLHRIQQADHKGRKIIHVNLSGMRPVDGLAQVIEAAKKIVRASPEKSVRILTEVSGARYDEETSELLKEFVKGNKPFVLASAVVGLSGLQKVLFSTILILTRRKIETFSDVLSAKDWLASQ